MLAGLLLFSLAGHETYAQVNAGLTNGTYAGIGNVWLNPAFLGNSRYYVDINLAGGDFFIHNNYAYLSKGEYRFSNFMLPGYQYPMHSKEYGQGERPAYTVEDKRPKDFFLDAHILGPSVMVAVNDHTFAVQTGFRMVNSIRDLPYDMANYFYYSLDYKPQHGIEYEHRDPIRFGTMAWSEVGISWAYMFKKYNRDRWSLGISAKYLMGHAGSYVYLDHMTYFTPDDDNVYVRDLNGEAAYALPVEYSENTFNGMGIYGRGMGFDIGVSYMHTEKGHSNIRYRQLCQQRYEDYKFKAGVSIMDIGWIRFSRQARKYGYHHVQGYWQQVDTLKPYYDNLEYISGDIGERFYGSTDGALEGNSFAMYLPATLGLQFDYHYVNNWYLSGSIRLPLNFAKSQVRAPAGLQVSPRLDMQELEIGLPVTLYDLRYPMLGAYLRFYNFTVGTDNLAGFLSMTNHYGFNVYFSVRISLIKGKCKRKLPRFCIDDFRFKNSI